MFLDESGACCNETRSYARSKIGKRAYAEKTTAKGKRVSIIGALTQKGICASMTFTGTLNHQVFSTFVNSILLETLEEGQTLIIDNARAHLHQESLDKIKKKGVTVLTLPPYHPELNAIEYAWSVCKSLFRKWKKTTEEGIFEAWEQALKFITPNKAQNFINRAIQMI